jgi:flavodoxin
VSEHFGDNLIVVYSVTGNTLNMAETIQKMTGGEILQIETEEVYPLGKDLIPYAKQERDELRLPTLKGETPDLGKYDCVFLGTPVWFHDVPPAVRLFLGEADFLGKPVIPFLTAGGGPGDTLATLTRLVKNGKLQRAKLLTRYSDRTPEEIDAEVGNWLVSLTADGSPSH